MHISPEFALHLFQSYPVAFGEHNLDFSVPVRLRLNPSTLAKPLTSRWKTEMCVELSLTRKVLNFGGSGY